MKTIQVLVVDDKEENRNAAAEYFKTRDDVEVDFAGTFRQAGKMISRKFYCYAIFDLQLPENEGDKTDSWGYNLSEIAEIHGIPWAIVTSHGNAESQRRSFLPNRRGESIYYPGKKKSDPSIWEEIFEELEEEFKTMPSDEKELKTYCERKDLLQACRWNF